MADGQFKFGQSAQTTRCDTAGAATGINSTTRFPSQQPSPYPLRSATDAADHPAAPLPTYIDQIMVRVASEGQIPAATQEIKKLLRERHRLKDGQADDFNLRDTAELAAAAVSTSRLMSGLLLAVALISLVVGGVGIMNIMMVSVTERTKEIGLRMAVGARPSDILWQFLVEAVLLCVLGGAVGVLLGRGGSWLVEVLLKWRTEPSLTAVLGAVGVSASSVGFYPA